ncbi:MAG: hypothetical protein ACRDTD_27105 [Pseudonocardiaceae bacterium]
MIDTANNTIAAAVPIDGRPLGVAITSDGLRAYVTTMRSPSELAVTGGAGACVFDDGHGRGEVEVTHLSAVRPASGDGVVVADHFVPDLS